MFKKVVVVNIFMVVKRKIKCPNCSHEWGTSSMLKFVTCSSCQLKIKNPYFEEKNQKGGNENV